MRQMTRFAELRAQKCKHNEDVGQSGMSTRRMIQGHFSKVSKVNYNGSVSCCAKKRVRSEIGCKSFSHCEKGRCL
jgi:hypothetical protein